MYINGALLAPPPSPSHWPCAQSFEGGCYGNSGKNPPALPPHGSGVSFKIIFVLPYLKKPDQNHQNVLNLPINSPEEPELRITKCVILHPNEVKLDENSKKYSPRMNTDKHGWLNATESKLTKIERTLIYTNPH